MDLVKRASSNLEASSVKDDQASILGRTYDGRQVVRFPTKKTKEYTLSSVVFYLLNSKKTLTEYVTLCKKSGVSPVSYVDRASIQADIESYSAGGVSGFFVQPAYTRPSAYDIPPIRNRKIIVVPDGVLSKIHIGNIEKLLADGIFDPVPFNPLSPSSKEILVDGVIYEVHGSVSSFEEEDWQCVRAVFMDFVDVGGLADVLPKMPSGCAVFTLSDERLKSVQILLRGKTVRNHSEILRTLRGQPSP